PADTIHFYLHDPPPHDTHTLSLHDALPISSPSASPPTTAITRRLRNLRMGWNLSPTNSRTSPSKQRNSLPSAFLSILLPLLSKRSEEHTSELSHVAISYAVFCLKKKSTYEI